MEAKDARDIQYLQVKKIKDVWYTYYAGTPDILKEVPGRCLKECGIAEKRYGLWSFRVRKHGNNTVVMFSLIQGLTDYQQAMILGQR